VTTAKLFAAAESVLQLEHGSGCGVFNALAGEDIRVMIVGLNKNNIRLYDPP
jgi:hypothetical protein